MAITTSDFFADSQSSRGDYITKDHSVALSQRHEVVAKAAKRGEGSHGGHIIGHTRSGKPIYSAMDKKYRTARHMQGPHAEPGIYRASVHNAKLLSTLHPDFSAEDHDDASRLHQDLANDAGIAHRSMEDHAPGKLGVVFSSHQHEALSDGHEHVAHLLRKRLKKNHLPARAATAGTSSATQRAGSPCTPAARTFTEARASTNPFIPLTSPSPARIILTPLACIST